MANEKYIPSYDGTKLFTEAYGDASKPALVLCDGLGCDGLFGSISCQPSPMTSTSFTFSTEVMVLVHRRRLGPRCRSRTFVQIF